MESSIKEYLWDITEKQHHKLRNGIVVEYVVIPQQYQSYTGYILFKKSDCKHMIFIGEEESKSLAFPLTLYHEYVEGVCFEKGVDMFEFQRLFLKYQDFILSCYPEINPKTWQEMVLFMKTNIPQLHKHFWNHQSDDQLPHMMAMIKEIDLCNKHYRKLIGELRHGITTRDRMLLRQK